MEVLEELLIGKIYLLYCEYLQAQIFEDSTEEVQKQGVECKKKSQDWISSASYKFHLTKLNSCLTVQCMILGNTYLNFSTILKILPVP